MDKRSLVISTVLALLLLLVGVGLIAYPFVSNYLMHQEQSKVMVAQQASTAENDQASIDAELKKARDYNNRLNQNLVTVTDPFNPNIQHVSEDEYDTLLNIAGDGVIGTVTIPKIDVSVPIYHGTEEDSLQKGAGHLEGTSLPVGGESTHSVIAGHNGLPSVQIFDRIGELVEGDYFVITVLGTEIAYRVTGSEVVEPDETESLRIQQGQDLVTLVTCTPYGINSHRLLVHAQRCDIPASWYEREKDGAAASASSPSALDVALPIAAVILAIGAGTAIGIVLARRRAHRNRVRKYSFLKK